MKPLLLLVIAEGIIALLALGIAWHASPPVDLRAARARLRDAQDRLSESLRRVPVAQKHTGSHRAGAHPAAVPTRLLTSAEAAGHAQAMHEIGAPYLPELPASPYPPLLEQVLPRKAVTAGHAPWQTAGQSVLTEEVEQQMREEYFAERQPVYGEAPQDTVDEAQRLAEVMLP